MAVFPDRIVQKNSTQSVSAVSAAIDPTIGSDPVIGGELVVQRSVGSAQILTLDANNNPVVVGISSGIGATAPFIKLNFEEDNTDTNYEYVNGSNPFSTSGKFGQCFRHNASDVAPRINPLRVLSQDSPVLGEGTWTLNFWFKADFDNDFYTPPSSKPQHSLLVVSLKDYLNGPGAFTITIDGGTADTGGIGTETSRTADLAKGAIVFGLGGQYGATETTISGIPSTGEVVTSANNTVCDDDWHYITFMHEGSGVYSCFVDGDLKERNYIGQAINHSLPGSSGIVQPSGFEFGGALVINDNEAFPGVEHHGMNFSMDGVTMYAGNAIYRGLREFAVPTTPPNDDAIQQPLDSLRTLIDTNVDSAPANGDTLVYNTTEGAWENAPAPSFSLTGNNLGDIGDVILAANASIANGETIIWDSANSQWINSPILIETLDLDTTSLISPFFPSTGAGNVIRWTGTNWKTDRLGPLDLNNAAGTGFLGLSDLVQDLNLDLYNINQLGDVAVSGLTQGDTLQWNATNQQFENIAAPAAQLSSNLLEELGDVKTWAQAALSPTATSTTFLSWDSSVQEWEPERLEWSLIANRPTYLNQFINNLDLANFTNYYGFLKAGDLSAYSFGLFGDVQITSPSESQVLVYRSGQWKNEFGPPANITTNSIGDLQDVTRTQAAPTLPATVTMEDLGHLVFDSPLLASNITYQVLYNHDLQGVGLSAIRNVDDTGSEVYVSRGGGVDMRSDVNFFRLRGKPTVTTNRPELRFETGDSFATPALGKFISLKMPDEVLEDQTYYLPQEDGDVGDVLATNGVGELSWVARVSNNNLGALSDVDLQTQLPVQNSSLVYNAAASMWVPGVAAVDLALSTLDDLSDVSYGGTPSTGQALLWSGSAWVPSDIAVSPALDDLTDVSYSGGSLDITALDQITFTSSDTPSVTTRKVHTNSAYGIGLSSYDTANPSIGSFFYAHESKGLELKTTQNSLIRLSGIYTQTNNRPELRWESGNPTADSPTGAYIGLKLPANHTVDQTYILPALDGSAGQALSTDGSGVLSWVTPGADLTTSSIDELQDVDTTTTAPTLAQALVWDGSAWVPGDVAVDEASPAIVWNVGNNGSSSYLFSGSGFPAAAANPDLYVVRGQKYTFNKSIASHPFQIEDEQGVQYTAGVAETQPLAVGELNWTVPMNAPSKLFYQCTAHASMRGEINVVGQGADLQSSNIEELANVSAAAPVGGQALVWDGTQWTPGNVVTGGSTGSAISQATTETQTSDVNGELTMIDLGTSGTLVSVEADAEAWVTFYSSAASRTADSSRAVAADPGQGSGVLAEFILPASTSVLTTPSTNYFNSEILVSESIYAMVRDTSTGAALNNVAVTVRAFAISGYTAVSGGTFGSG